MSAILSLLEQRNSSTKSTLGDARNVINVGQENSTSAEPHFEVYGSSPPVAVFHLWPLNGDAWEKQAAALFAVGQRVTTHDRRGFGWSSKPATGFREARNESDTYRGTTSVEIGDGMRRHSRNSKRMKRRYLVVSLVILLGLCSTAASAQPPVKHPRDFTHRRTSTDASHHLEGIRDRPIDSYQSSSARPRTDYNSICDEQCNERAWLDGDQRLLDEP
jgi:hypothetical protein